MKFGFIFPGQGSQFEGMGLDFLSSTDIAKKYYADAETILNWSVTDLSLPENKEKLSITLYTQPALYILSCIIDHYLKESGIKPVVTAGHSAGEYAALTSAGCWDFETGLKVIAERARLMHETSKPGAMAAVLGLDADTIDKVCADSNVGIVQVANYNSPKQTVITGEKEAVQAVSPKLKESGAKRVVPLPVSGAFHSPLMKDAQQEFNNYIQSIELKDANIPWISNNSAEIISESNTIREHLVRQFCEPVRWTNTIQNMENECDKLIEVGAGKVLKGLVSQCSDKLECETTSNFEDTKMVIENYV